MEFFYITSIDMCWGHMRTQHGNCVMYVLGEEWAVVDDRGY